MSILSAFHYGPYEKGRDHHNRKNRKGRRYRMITITTGPARDANQKTTFTKRIENADFHRH